MTSCDPQNLWQKKRIDSPELSFDLHTGGDICKPTLTYTHMHNHYKHTIIKFLKLEEEEVVMGKRKKMGKGRRERSLGTSRRGQH